MKSLEEMFPFVLTKNGEKLTLRSKLGNVKEDAGHHVNENWKLREPTALLFDRNTLSNRIFEWDKNLS